MILVFLESLSRAALYQLPGHQHCILTRYGAFALSRPRSYKVSISSNVAGRGDVGRKKNGHPRRRNLKQTKSDWTVPANILPPALATTSSIDGNQERQENIATQVLTSRGSDDRDEKPVHRSIFLAIAKRRDSRFVAACIAFLGCIQLLTFIPKIPEWLPETFGYPVIIALFGTFVIGYLNKSILKESTTPTKYTFWVAYVSCCIVLAGVVAYAIARALPKEILKQASVPGQDIVLTGRTLTGVSYSAKDLSFGKFDDTNLVDVDFIDTDLSQSTFAGATLTKVDFTGAKLCGVDFRGSDLRSTDTIGYASSVSFVIYDSATQFPAGFIPTRMPGLMEYKDRPLLVSCRAGVTNLVR